MKKVKRETIPEYGLSHSRINGMALRKLDEKGPSPAGQKVNLPHRDDHYMLVLLQEGILNIEVDFDEKEIERPALFMIFPQQVHLVQPQTALSGWSVSFHAEVLPDDLKKQLDDSRDTGLSQFYLAGSWNEHVDSIFKAINQLFIQPSRTSSEAGAALLTGLLYAIVAADTNPASTDKSIKTRPQQIKNQFVQLLYMHYKEQKKPSFYAAKLNISTSHLNDSIKHMTGRSVTRAIQEHCVLEASRLLHHTGLDVKEISYQLGFPNVSHFISIFKNITGVTPKQYRLK